jgi:Fe-S-cluster containining protein
MDLSGPQQQKYFINQELADKVKMLVAVTLADGRQEAAVLALASQAVELADQLINYFETVNHLPRPIACRVGCNFCCFNQVEVTPPEALLIRSYIAQNFSQQERESLRQRVSRALYLKAGKSKEKIARLRGKLPCPLLQEGKCSVYEVRPLVCRAMHALAADSCEAELRLGKLERGEYYAHRYELVWSISSGLQTGCREAGCQTGILDLDVALQDFFSHEKTGERWLASKQVWGVRKPGSWPDFLHFIGAQPKS